MTNPFAPMVREAQKARILITGPAGSGKSYTALAFALTLAAGGRVAIVDTEKDRMKLYADRFPGADHVTLTDHSPQRYVEMIDAAIANGYAVIVIDSLTHAWKATLQAVDATQNRSGKQDGREGWRIHRPHHERLMERIINSDIHVVATARSKMEYDWDSKKKEALGLAPIQDGELPYEFDLILDMTITHQGLVSKVRGCVEYADRTVDHPTGEFIAAYRDWLASAPDPAPKVWQVRFAEAIDALGGTDAEIRVRKLMNGADPSVLDNDAAWDRLQSLVANARGDQHGAASPDAGTSHPGVADEAGEATVASVAPGPSAGETAGSPAGGAGAGGRPSTDGEAGVLDGQPAPVITQPQLKRLAVIANELGIADAEWKAIACHVAGVTSRKDIPRDRYEAVEAALREAAEDAANAEATAAVAGEGD